jgi:uncharacterized protein YceH (UPF0502 family)
MEEPHPSPAPQATPTPTLRPATPVDLESRVAALEAELATQTRRIDRLLDELGE